jgi:hypothetical protein
MLGRVPLSVQIVGSALILLAFLGAQSGRILVSSRLYLMLNVVGSCGLAVSAFAGSQWGFVALEVVWTAASVAGLVRSYSSPPSA